MVAYPLIFAALCGTLALAAPFPSGKQQQRGLIGDLTGKLPLGGLLGGSSNSQSGNGNIGNLPNINVAPNISPNVSPTVSPSVNGPGKTCLGISVCDPITVGGDGSTNTNNG